MTKDEAIARWRCLTSGIGMVALLAGCHSGRDVAPAGVSPAGVSPATVGGASPPQTPNAAGTPSTATELSPAAAAPTVDPAPAEPSASSSCETRKASIEAAFVEASRCTTDADCTTLMPGCPFGCTRAINRSSDVDSISADIAAYNEACNRCVYRCRPVDQPPTCKAGVCTLLP